MRTGRSRKGKLLSDFAVISSYESQPGVTNGQDFGIFSRKFSALDFEIPAGVPSLQLTAHALHCD